MERGWNDTPFGSLVELLSRHLELIIDSQADASSVAVFDQSQAGRRRRRNDFKDFSACMNDDASISSKGGMKALS
jgi:hypothetical protein